VHILVARGTDADLRTALDILKVLDEIAERTHNTYFKMILLALRALALNTQGKTGAAIATLQQAVDLAQLGGMIRVFAELGKPMQAMLCQLRSQGRSVQVIERILDAFPGDATSLDHRNLPAKPEHHPALGNASLPEPLTPRELDILNLMDGPLSNNEITQKLCISYATVKRHTINIYGKLGVNSRKEAIARAKELNLLPPD
jgi:LuxR family transcriptional regulator, maltose regulon positive regulatory protein